MVLVNPSSGGFLFTIGSVIMDTGHAIDREHYQRPVIYLMEYQLYRNTI